VKHLILAIVAATLSLSAAAESTNLNSSKSNVVDQTSVRGKPTKEQIAECNASKDAKEKKACQQQFGIAVSDPGVPNDKKSTTK
jgi:hypothetical protein